jgi:hypothetical protein
LSSVMQLKLSTVNSIITIIICTVANHSGHHRNEYLSALSL